MKILSKAREVIRNLIYRHMYDFDNQSNLQFCWDKIRSVVICKIDGKLGDAEVISPFIATLKRKFPRIKMIVLSSENIAEVYKNCFSMDQVVVCSRRPGKDEIERISKQIISCDLYITIEGKFRFHDFYILYKLKPKYVAGINSGVTSLNLNMSLFATGAHITDYFKGLLIVGGVSAGDIIEDYRPIMTDDSIEFVKHFCSSNQIAFAPWGASKHRRLKDEVIEMIVSKLQMSGYQVALLFPPGENKLRQKIESCELKAALVEIPEVLSIYELVAVISQSKAVISVDTANVHLACAFDMPIFGIYSGCKPYQFVLWGPKPGHKDAVIFYRDKKMIDELDYSDIEHCLDLFMDKIV